MTENDPLTQPLLLRLFRVVFLGLYNRIIVYRQDTDRYELVK